ncbi:DUF92 domain-containing protein [Cytobacillus depressus]|uniref:DUF92 domain-containing protein n=1 Tax=Cytobacillus depressus TaxID=1602942 RepID=A0A6L3VA14_9BACI|nr:DUF92 domain-containing protein [Cytobacillus depressus]KAB2338518.1 DUF92 domain-containing protein [Cytobacillus depressus]
MDDTILLILFIAVTSISGYVLKLLTLSGSLAAFVIGICVSIGFGIEGLLLLGFFFISSSLWSKYKRKFKMNIEQRHEKGSRRDWAQVAANGGAAALFSMLNLVIPDPAWIFGFSISAAAANSDTWASEIGSLSKKPPVFIRTFKRTDAGTSGAISLLGTVAALCGSFTIAALAFFLFHLPLTDFFIIFIFGFAGNIIDTLFGAFGQVVYQCKICGAEIESTIHCRNKTIHKRGLLVMNNDFVNFSSCFLSASLGMLFTSLLN